MEKMKLIVENKSKEFGFFLEQELKMLSFDQLSIERDGVDRHMLVEMMKDDRTFVLKPSLLAMKSEFESESVRDRLVIDIINDLKKVERVM